MVIIMFNHLMSYDVTQQIICLVKINFLFVAQCIQNFHPGASTVNLLIYVYFIK